MADSAGGTGIDWSLAGKKSSGGLGTIIHSALEMTSTQTAAKDAARRGEPDGAVFVADSQSAGHGRRDRVWRTVPGRDLTFSVVMRPEVSPRHVAMLGLAAAVAAARSLKKIDGIDASRVAIKWPNDVLVGEKKICGIICDCTGAESAIEYAVLGIGINVNGTEDELVTPDSPDRPGATSLRAETGGKYDLPSLLASVLAELDGAARLVSTVEGRRELAAVYESLCGTIGRGVRIITADGEFAGTATGITEDGAIIVSGDWGERVFYVGDVVHARRI
ncbi:MAG: biotin--[acetyl-CoA-carboxylase] ligase [Synergistaceae bacterium]|nr:biotin--[acetyl-CoA-carboxylase] ligase [Synergistaceae bacterium]